MPELSTPASELRVALDRLFAEHAFLTLEAMRTGLGTGADFPAAGGALEGNTTDIEAAIADIYGEEAAATFGDLWRSHIGYVVDYTRAVADEDQAAVDAAVAGLETYRLDFSAFLAQANPNLNAEAVSTLLEDHITQLQQIAAYESGDYEAAYAGIRATYAHMFTIGDALAAAISEQFPERYTGADFAISPALELRVTLHRLLGEHSALSVRATRAGLVDAPDFEAAVAAMDANSGDLEGAIVAIYDVDAGEAFGDLWRSHTRYYLDYVEAAANDDDAARQAAETGLEQYRTDFSRFLAEANPYLVATTLDELLTHHTDQLVGQVEAYVAEDYERAYELAREAHAHVGTLADGLASAIASQFPEQFPDASVATGVERFPGRGVPALLLVAAAACISAVPAAAVLVRRRKGN